MTALKLVRRARVRVHCAALRGDLSMRIPSRFREALRIGLPALTLAAAATAAEAACLRHVADAPVPLRASFGPGGVAPANVGVTYVGQ
jgi:hypothetical protein